MSGPGIHNSVTQTVESSGYVAGEVKHDRRPYVMIRRLP